MERLTKEFTSCEYCEDVECTGYKNSCIHRKVYEKLSHYEDLEEQGRLIELPCKVGDTVWCIDEEYEEYFGYLFMGMCGEYVIVCPEEYSFQDDFQRQIESMSYESINYEGVDVYIYHRKNVFLTKEEAEAKLKELKEGVE